MKMLDLFCGRGGWTKGFIAQGWECVGIDLNPQPEYPAEFIRADCMEVFSRRDGSFYICERPDGGPILWEYYPDFVCVSSPCEEFSVHGMKHFHPNPKFPETGCRLFNHARVQCEVSRKPFIMENVRAAQKFVGPAVNHCGPFYLWGNAVPAIMPKNLFALQKGMAVGTGAEAKALTPEQRTLYRKQFPVLMTGSKSKERAEFTSKFAEIPVALSAYIAEVSA